MTHAAPLLMAVFLLAGPAAGQDRFSDPSQPLSAPDGPVLYSTPDNGKAGPPDAPAHQTNDEMAPVGSVDGAMDGAMDEAVTGAAIRQALEGEITRLEAEIAELRRLRGWQARLHDAAQTDPIGARRQRRDISSCLTTPLAQWCPQLTGMYRGQTP